MSDDKRSLFGKHLEILGEEELSTSMQNEKEKIEQLNLPPLRLNTRPSFWQRFLLQPQAIGFAMAFGLALFFLIPQKEVDRLTTKGSLQVSVYWERDGQVSNLKENSQLQNGDKIGASIISSKPAFAYWGVSDKDHNIISDLSQILESELVLQPGLSQTFRNSFTLVEPNQGENLIVFTCSKSEELPKLQNQYFIEKIIQEKSLQAKNCVFMGFRLRKIEGP